jgi:hypothetical protein
VVVDGRRDPLPWALELGSKTRRLASRFHPLTNYVLYRCVLQKRRLRRDVHCAPRQRDGAVQTDGPGARQTSD